ncbi:MAG: SWIM zinc finger family protein [Lachnospiraceae bacterium]|nr:SWIM zinc finger family protein [Robinsoniella sp.]MDY3767953.1 SWIM zinc finger family protein [Lachnospiraceae bacterium]
MVRIEEQQIAALAPNVAAASNGKKISANGGFVKLFRSGDDTFYMGECKGSGKANYITSADFIDPEAPVFRCSCPSRQFPCKHSLALLYEIAAEKRFEEIEIPQDIIEQRAKREARAAKKERENRQENQRTEKTKKVSKTNKSAKKKKAEKQLEGLSMTSEVVTDLLRSGLGTIGGTSLKGYRELARQMGDYYLPGPQVWMNRLILVMESYQQSKDEKECAEAVKILVRLHALVKKSQAYLKEKLETENFEDDNNILIEELGGIWQLEKLNQLGLKKENACLVQLSFQVNWDPATREYIDLGYWMDADTGEIVTTRNYRPMKALKYIRQDDSVFGTAKIPVLTYYPGNQNRRVRFEKASFEPLTDQILENIRNHAAENLALLVKAVKNEIKNTLSENFVAAAVHFHTIGKNEHGIIMEDHSGNRILLKDMEASQETTWLLEKIPEKSVLSDQVLFGAIYYEESTRRICMQPYSVVTGQKIIRLLY